EGLGAHVLCWLDGTSRGRLAGCVRLTTFRRRTGTIGAADRPGQKRRTMTMNAFVDSALASNLAFTWLALLVEVSLKGLALLVLAGLCTLALRCASAAYRHLVWCAALGGLLALPVLVAVAPTWRLAVLPQLGATTASHPAAAASQHHAGSPTVASMVAGKV